MYAPAFASAWARLELSRKIVQYQELKLSEMVNHLDELLEKGQLTNEKMREVDAKIHERDENSRNLEAQIKNIHAIMNNRSDQNFEMIHEVAAKSRGRGRGENSRDLEAQIEMTQDATEDRSKLDFETIREAAGTMKEMVRQHEVMLAKSRELAKQFSGLIEKIDKKEKEYKALNEAARVLSEKVKAQEATGTVDPSDVQELKLMIEKLQMSAIDP